jgi:hypothetical protein
MLPKLGKKDHNYNPTREQNQAKKVYVRGQCYNYGEDP